MERLAPEVWNKVYGSAFRAVFQATDPFDAPLTAEMTARGLLYPVAYLLEPMQFAAVVTAARSVGDECLCLSVTEQFDGVSGTEAVHYIFDYWEGAEYQSLGEVGVLENALYSPSGQWGLLISHEQHAVVGGARMFWDTLVAEFPEIDSSLERFLQTWAGHARRRHVDTSWLSGLLTHVYGPERARAELAAAR